MAVVQIYPIINSAAEQTLGSAAIKAVDSNTIVAQGQQVLSSTQNTENFLNFIVQRIARTIVSYRMYNSVLRPIVYDDIRWGAIVQKLKGQMPQAMEDKAYDLKDGESVDMYIIMKPDVKQKFFVNSTPYSFGITIQRWQLQRAFLGETEMAAFISAIFGEVQNALELGFENLGYMTMGNYIVNADSKQFVHVLTDYNTAKGTSLTSDNSYLDNDYLRYSIMTMNLWARKMQSMSTEYNAEGETRHTPFEYQRFIASADFYESMRTVVQWQAFHEQYVSKTASTVVPYWQSQQSPVSVYATDKSGAEKRIDNIMGFIHDRDALGVYRKEQEVLTTPVNARGRYTNTFWHEEQMWINDMSENGIIFLND